MSDEGRRITAVSITTDFLADLLESAFLRGWSAMLVLTACSPVAPDEPELDLPTNGTVVVRVDVPLPLDLRPQYFDSAQIVLQSRWQDSLDVSPYRFPITGSAVVVDGLQFGLYRVAFEQPRVDGWGDRAWVNASGFTVSANRASYGDWFALGPHFPEKEVQHVADYDAATSGVGYTSDCYYDSGYHCHRDKWTFTTGPVTIDGTFSDGETHIILVDRRFFRADTVASGRVSGTFGYPNITMRWDVLGGCKVTGDLFHDRRLPVKKWLRVVCPEANIDLTGKF